MTTIQCIECAGEVTLGEQVLLGEIAECPECGVELEVVALEPLRVEVAPEIEEDWGE